MECQTEGTKFDDVFKPTRNVTDGQNIHQVAKPLKLLSDVNLVPVLNVMSLIVSAEGIMKIL